MGRPKIKFDDARLKRIENLAALGLTEEEICRVEGINERTLNRHKQNDRVLSAIKKGRATVRVTVGALLMQKVKAGDLRAIIWFEKSRFGLRDNTHVDVNMSGTTEIKHTGKPSVNMTLTELHKIYQDYEQSLTVPTSAAV